VEHVPEPVWVALAAALGALVKWLTDVRRRARQTSSDSTVRLQKIEDNWKENVDRTLFSAEEGSVRARFHAHAQLLQELKLETELLKRSSVDMKAGIATLTEKVDEIVPAVVEIRTIVQELRDRRRDSGPHAVVREG